MERFKLKNLEPNHGYVIQVILKINKEIIAYQPLKLFKSRYCFKPILNSNHNQLPNFVSSSLQPHRHIEDNNILVP